MALKFSLINLVAFLLLGAAVYIWGPAWNGLWGSVINAALYAVVFGVCFVVVKKR